MKIKSKNRVIGDSCDCCDGRDGIVINSLIGDGCDGSDGCDGI